MPIKVTCQCGKSFAAKDELAGKAVKCPNCQQPLRIPGAPASAPAPSRAPSAGIAAPLPSAAPRQAATSASAFGPPPAAGNSGSVFDEIGLKQAPVGAAMCPGCAAPLTPGAIICIKCGYNMKLGRRMETVKMGAGGGPGGHDGATADLMNKAAVTIEEDKEEERKKTKEGLPWWAYGIGLLFVVGFIIMMMVLPQKTAMQAGGGMVAFLGTILILYGYIRILILAFSDNVGFGIMVLLTGCFGLCIYTFMKWDRAGGYFLMWLAGQIVQSLGYGAIVLAQNFQGPEEEARYQKPSPPVIMARAESLGMPTAYRTEARFARDHLQ